MKSLTRRRFLPTLAVPLLAAAKSAGHTVGFNNGTYGAKSMQTSDALHAMAEIGYDGVELALMPGWPTDPASMSAADRQDLRRLVNDTGLALPAFLESLPFKGTTENRAHNLERLRLAADLGHFLSPGNPPVVETIIGGKAEEWDAVKGRMLDELAGWAKLGEELDNVFCFKPHAAHAVDTPERAVWLMNQIRSKWLRVVYDYSHFYVAGLSLMDSLRKLLPYTSYIAIKDSAGTEANHQFLLPGDGKTDYPTYFQLLKEFGYSGYVGVEITSMIHTKPGYQPLPTLRLCYERIAPIFKQAGLERPKRGS
jgi:sugar phosphate isomerase/epimerase